MTNLCAPVESSHQTRLQVFDDLTDTLLNRNTKTLSSHPMSPSTKNLSLWMECRIAISLRRRSTEAERACWVRRRPSLSSQSEFHWSCYLHTAKKKWDGPHLVSRMWAIPLENRCEWLTFNIPEMWRTHEYHIWVASSITAVCGKSGRICVAPQWAREKCSVFPCQNELTTVFNQSTLSVFILIF